MGNPTARIGEKITWKNWMDQFTLDQLIDNEMNV